MSKNRAFALPAAVLFPSDRLFDEFIILYCFTPFEDLFCFFLELKDLAFKVTGEPFDLVLVGIFIAAELAKPNLLADHDMRTPAETVISVCINRN